jgi:hypothetical protein
MRNEIARLIAEELNLNAEDCLVAADRILNLIHSTARILNGR